MKDTKPKSRRPRDASVLLRIDPDAPLSLQHQIRGQILEAILSGVFRANRRLPSSRDLARQLGVARNTVVLAYQQLVADGHLVSRERSGLFVNESGMKGFALKRSVGRTDERCDIDWGAHIHTSSPARETYRCPPDWQRFPYPFVEGRFDRSLYPIAEWREVQRLALSARQADDWSRDSGEIDDPLVLSQLCEKILPRRGIKARPDEVLLTGGTKEGLHLIVELLVASGMKVGVEEPGNHELVELLKRKGAHVVPGRVDEHGLLPDPQLASCALLYVTPSHQRPTAATLSMSRRADLLHMAEENDALVLEDDFECETNYLDDAYPALRGMDRGERVVYVASLSRAISPLLRLGMIVAAPGIIREARRLSHLISRPPPLSTQRAAAFFLSLGHHERTMVQLGRTFRERLVALRDALNHYLPQTVAIAPVRGGTTLWVHGPEGVDARDLARAAESHGVLIEPVNHYYASDTPPSNVFRLSITGIPKERIRPGVAALSNVIRELSAGSLVTLDPGKAHWLKARELQRIIPGATFLYKTVYGDPCTIELHRGGRMVGRSGYANEEQDEGCWWIENDLWCRRWDNWAYGETAKYRTRLEYDQIQWFNEAGRLVDSAVFVRGNSPNA